MKRDWRDLSAEKGHTDGWFWLLLGVIIALLLLLKGPDVIAFTSPLRSPLQTELPTKPKGLANCPPWAIENYEDVGYPTCNTGVVMEYELDIEPEYIAGCVLGWDRLEDLCSPAATPVPPPEVPSPLPVQPATTTADEIYLGTWSDSKCAMWYSPSEGRVIRLECP